MGESLSWQESIDLVEELKREPASHLNASINGWAWASDFGPVAAGLLLQTYVNTHQDPKKPAEPMRFPMPWDEPEKPITEEERTTLLADYASRSAMRDL